jgi:hypothetical protein
MACHNTTTHRLAHHSMGHRTFHVFQIAVLCIMCLGYSAANSMTLNINVTYPKPVTNQERPVAPFSTSEKALDCSDAIPVDISIGDQLVINGDTSEGTNTADLYSCIPWDESGPETIYAITLLEPALLNAKLNSPNADLDIFLLSDCSASSCLAAHAAEFMAEVPAGTWFIVVDGYQGASGAFELILTAYPTGLSTQACLEAISINGSVGDQTFDGNLLGRDNLVTMADCGSFLEWGGEQWFLLSVPPRTEITLELRDLLFDGALWIFADCGDDPVCLAFADGHGIGSAETLVYASESDMVETVMVGVDSFREISSANGDNEFDGAFTLAVTSVVPTTNTTVSDLKGMFR